MDSSRQKRGHESDGSSPHPKRKHPIASTVAEPLKIIDLNDDCLGKIFEHLNKYSLLNVAVANEWLRPAAQDRYKRRFEQTKIVFNVEHDIISTNYLQFNDLKSFLQCMRCLESSIANMTIGYRNLDSKRCDHIDQYLNRYLAESLMCISFVDRATDFTRNFGKPFANVQRVAVLNSCLGNKFVLFPQWFPNLRQLTLKNVMMDDRSIKLPLQHLQRLDIDVNNGTLSYGFTKKEAARLLRLCPRLSSLEIRMSADHGMTITTLLNMIKGNPLITKLMVRMDRFWTHAYQDEVQRLTDEHSNLIELELPNYRFTIDTISALIRNLAGLRTIHFGMKNTEENLERTVRGFSQWQQANVSAHDTYRNQRIVLMKL